MKTVFITGTSSGIGKAAAEGFLREGWNVVASMRNINDSPFPKHDNLLIVQLDVTKDKEIDSAYAKTVERFGSIDVLINNAGYGLIGPIEELSQEDIQKQFDSNVFGLLAMTKRVLPDFRKYNKGIIINISSMYGKITMPYFGIYAATKHAVEAISESLSLELEDTNIKVRIIEPGAIKTNFFDNSAIAKKIETSSYNPRLKRFITAISNKGKNGDSPQLVTNALIKAANPNNKRMLYVPDRTARLLINLHRFLPLAYFSKGLKKNIG